MFRLLLNSFICFAIFLDISNLTRLSFIEKSGCARYFVCVPTHFKLKDLNKNEMPRERLLQNGTGALSDSELLAIILGSGGKENSALQLASRILIEFGGFVGLLSTDIEQLKTIRDIGEAKATEIKAACEIAHRIRNTSQQDKTFINQPSDVAQYLKKEFFEKDREHLYLISLNSRRQVVSKDLISVGTVNETLIHPREIFKKAILKNAVSVILAHNHPSGDTEPSREDIEITGRVAKAGVAMSIPVLDHVIVFNDSFSSLKRLNLFPKDLGFNTTL
jgi:DNA repair protein RadC